MEENDITPYSNRLNRANRFRMRGFFDHDHMNMMMENRCRRRRNGKKYHCHQDVLMVDSDSDDDKLSGKWKYMKKGKAAIIDGEYSVGEKDCKVALDITIDDAVDIDNSSTYASSEQRFHARYKAIAWVEPGQERETKPVNGSPNPAWSHDCGFYLGDSSSMYGKFLHLEVVRVRWESDVGTSNGEVLVGRTRIPVPTKIDGRNGGKFVLVKIDDETSEPKSEGYIRVTMLLRKFG